MKNKFLLQTYLLLVLLLPLQAGTKVYTVDTLIRLALQNSPELKISELNLSASKEEQNIAQAGYYPRLDLQASAAKIGASNVLQKNEGMIDDTLLSGTLSLQQLIYDFGKTGANSDFTKYESQSTSFENIQKIADKKRDVKEAYYNVLKAIALISVQKENVKLNKAQLYRSKQYFKAGIRTKIDISDAKVALIKSQIDLKNAQYNLQLAYATLDQVIGFSSLEQKYRVYANTLNFDTIQESIKDYDLALSQAIKYAYEHKPIIKAYVFKTKSSHALINGTTSEYYPEFSFGAGYTKQQLEKYQLLQPEDRWQLGVNLNWNLYQGGASSSKVQKSKLNAAASNYALQDLKLSVKKEVTSEYINVARKKDTFTLSHSLLIVSSQKFEQASKRYEHGLSDYIELQQARQDYIDAKAGLVIDYYNYYIAKANLDNAIGK